MLLEREEVNPDRADTKHVRTPISWAAENGHEGVVKMLLKRQEVNPDQADTTYGQKPIALAAEDGHEGAVNMLLEREEANVNQVVTGSGSTLLSWMASRQGAVRPSEREDINPDWGGVD